MELLHGVFILAVVTLGETSLSLRLKKRGTGS